MNLHRTIILIIACLFITCMSQTATKQPVNYKQWLINMAINDGYKTVDSYVRETFWYYLRGSELLDYRAKVTTSSLNYKIVYMAKGGIFLINAALDKRKWEIQLNNIVKLNA
jgi:hypothetical protein